MSTSIQLIYASTSGNTEIVMETIAQVLESKGYQTVLHRAEKTPISVLLDNEWFILGTSTWEHGAVNPFFRRLIKDMKEVSLKGKLAAFAGCGDRRYEPVLFCEGIEKVRRVWESREGSSLGEMLKINGEPYGLLETDVRLWAEDIAAKFAAATAGTGTQSKTGLAGVRSFFSK